MKPGLGVGIMIVKEKYKASGLAGGILLITPIGLCYKQSLKAHSYSDACVSYDPLNGSLYSFIDI